MNHLLKEIYSAKKKIINKKTLVIGDSIIDESLISYSKKINQECLDHGSIYDIKKRNVDLGGAYNISKTLNCLNVSNDFFSILNKNCLNEFNISNFNGIESDDYSMSKKSRIIYKALYETRLDFDLDDYTLKSDLALNVKDKIDKLDYYEKVIISDYDKGLFSKDIEYKILDKFSNSFSIVDPKFCKDFRLWKNCTVFKPNFNDAKNISGQHNSHKILKTLKKMIGCKYVVMTNQENGCFVYDGDQVINFKNPLKSKAFNIVGAGDIYTAALSAFYNGCIFEAAKLALNISSLYVNCNPKSFFNLISKRYLNDKLVSPEFLINRDYSLVWTNGCFDIIHSGHISYLNQSKNYGDKLVVGVNNDESVKQNKGDKRPINEFEDRISVLNSLDCIDYIVEIKDKDPGNIIRKIKPDIVTKGSDWKKIIGSEFSERSIFIDIVKGKSTTNLINTIQQQK